MASGRDGQTGQPVQRISALMLTLQETEPVQNLLHNWVV